MSNENENDKQAQQQPEAEAKAADEKPAKPVKKPAAKAASSSEEGAAGGSDSPAEKPKPAAAKAAGAKAEAVKKDVPKKEETPPPPPEPGKYAQLLMVNGFHPTPLGNDAKGQEMVDVKADELLSVCRFLKENEGSRFDLLVSVSGVDWKDRLEAVYHLYSTKTFERLVLKATAVDEKLPSVVSVWITADWHERETYDLFGIVFEGHPNLKRILMPSDWVGFPLRKDYKVEDPRLVWNER